MKMRKTKMILIAVMTLCMHLTAVNAMAETVQAQDTAAMNQKLDAMGDAEKQTSDLENSLKYAK